MYLDSRKEGINLFSVGICSQMMISKTKPFPGTEGKGGTTL